MSAIQASILSEYNDRNVGLSTIFGSNSHCGASGTTASAPPATSQTGYSTQPQTIRRNSIDSRLSKLGPKTPVVDLMVIMLSVPALIILALMLEANLRENWAETPDSRWTVLGIGLALITVSLILCGYATHRMGVCLWAGPQDCGDESNFNRDNSMLDIYNYDLPPSYEQCMIDCDPLSGPPPPSYEYVVIEIEKKRDDETKWINDNQLTTNYI